MNLSSIGPIRRTGSAGDEISNVNAQPRARNLGGCLWRPRGASRFYELPIRNHKSLEHGPNELDGVGDRLARVASQDFGIELQVPKDRCRQFVRHFHGFVVGDVTEFQLGHGQLL